MHSPSDTFNHDPAVIDSLSNWMQSKGVTLFGEFFDVTRPERRKEAAIWMSTQMQSWYAYRAQKDKATTEHATASPFVPGSSLEETPPHPYLHSDGTSSRG
jgi:hypothetical protein